MSDIKILSGSLKIGNKFSMNPGSYVAVVNNGTVSIGNGVRLNRNALVICHDAITIGDDCSIGPNVLIYDHDHRFGPDGLEAGYKTTPVTIGNNCWIGGGVTILRGTTIGDGCVIGAGTVVKGDIPPHTLVRSDRELIFTPIS